MVKPDKISALPCVTVSPDYLLQIDKFQFSPDPQQQPLEESYFIIGLYLKSPKTKKMGKNKICFSMTQDAQEIRFSVDLARVRFSESVPKVTVVYSLHDIRTGESIELGKALFNINKMPKENMFHLVFKVKLTYKMRTIGDHLNCLVISGCAIDLFFDGVKFSNNKKINKTALCLLTQRFNLSNTSIRLRCGQAVSVSNIIIWNSDIPDAWISNYSRKNLYSATPHSPSFKWEAAQDGLSFINIHDTSASLSIRKVIEQTQNTEESQMSETDEQIEVVQDDNSMQSRTTLYGNISTRKPLVEFDPKGSPSKLSYNLPEPNVTRGVSTYSIPVIRSVSDREGGE